MSKELFHEPYKKYTVGKQHNDGLFACVPISMPRDIKVFGKVWSLFILISFKIIKLIIIVVISEIFTYS